MFQAAIELVTKVPRRESLLHPLSPIAGNEARSPDGPGLRRLLIVRVLEPDDRATCLARCLSEAVDIWYDSSGDGHLGGLTWCHEAVLKVDDDKRRTGRVDPLERVEATAAYRDPL